MRLVANMGIPLDVRVTNANVADNQVGYARVGWLLV